MNKQLYRVVFSQKHGVHMAVAENASGQRKGGFRADRANASGASSGFTAGVLQQTARFSLLALSLALLFSPVRVAHAQIVADTNAAANQRPVVESTANGLPLIQIAAPNAAGISHNQYQQFNVGQNGAILNNSVGNIRTQQGGLVGGNSHLTQGPARIILNEVTSNNPSQLRGYLEVAGQRADVVLSNPNGIFVDGAGFINASRGVLTTGRPDFDEEGYLQNLRVTQGQIQIQGAGWNDAKTAQLDLIARSVKVNGKLWADRLNVITGVNEVDYSDLGVQLINNQAGDPTVGIDVAALGGMYANKINLVGTAAGVGVNSVGQMVARGGDFSIDSVGKVILAQALDQDGKVALDADGKALSRTAAQRDLTIKSRDVVAVKSDTYANRRLTIEGQHIDIADTQIQAGGILNVFAKGSVNGQNAQLATTGNLNILGANVDMSGARAQADRDINIHAAQVTMKNAALLTEGKLEISATNVDLADTTAFAKRGVNIFADNQADLKKTQLVTEGRFDIQSNKSIDLTEADVQAKGSMRIVAAHHANLQKTHFATEGRLEVQANRSINLTEANIRSGDQFRLSSFNIDMSGANVQAGRGVNLRAENQLVMQKAIIATQGGLDIRAHRVDMAQAEASAKGNIMIQGRKQVDLQKSRLSTEGRLDVAADDVDISLVNARATRGIVVSAGRLKMPQAVLDTDGFLKIHAASITRTGGQ